ncbi:hypothetical protein BC628DRAFT_1123435 [Trametes gibbosa]|nr:hypothetical protein BC628DRAFT_1123435 [Trametes gibbosa]
MEGWRPEAGTVELRLDPHMNRAGNADGGGLIAEDGYPSGRRLSCTQGAVWDGLDRLPATVHPEYARSSDKLRGYDQGHLLCRRRPGRHEAMRRSLRSSENVRQRQVARGWPLSGCRYLHPHMGHKGSRREGGDKGGHGRGGGTRALEWRPRLHAYRRLLCCRFETDPGKGSSRTASATGIRITWTFVLARWRSGLWPSGMRRREEHLRSSEMGLSS